MKYPHPECIPPKLYAENVPKEYHPYLHLAQKYGVLDDSYRLEMIDSLEEKEIAELKNFYPVYEEMIDKWLGNPKNSETNTNEYLAFSALGIVSEYLYM